MLEAVLEGVLEGALADVLAAAGFSFFGLSADAVELVELFAPAFLASLRESLR